MDRRATWLACGATAAGMAGTARAADRALGTTPLLSTAGALAACAYLVGTFGPNAQLFGRPVRPGPVAGAFALTFDDGPDPCFTPRIADRLAERGHGATFFVLGRAVEAYPLAAAHVVAAGHELGNHGCDHRLLAFSPPRVVREQIRATETAVEHATGSRPVPLFRAPHGVRSPWLGGTVTALGYSLCGWDGAVFDTAEPGSEAIVARVVPLLRPGAVLLLHDGDGSGRRASREQTVAALPAILDAAEERGLRSVPLSALLARSA